ncbi:hypothetical protein HELRODRAFT_153611, partial [Helobdella robusta]|uniref:RING-type domain-containing protein n=1 Tax=Helobdella robusta TaxID=6412 RepID=T1EL98_HELRO
KISNGQCLVCFEDFTENSVVTQLSCKHVFHYRCIATWLEMKSSCPLCRKDV